MSPGVWKLSLAQQWTITGSGPQEGAGRGEGAPQAFKCRVFLVSSIILYPRILDALWYLCVVPICDCAYRDCQPRKFSEPPCPEVKASLHNMTGRMAPVDNLWFQFTDSGDGKPPPKVTWQVFLVRPSLSIGLSRNVRSPNKLCRLSAMPWDTQAKNDIKGYPPGAPDKVQITFGDQCFTVE